MIREITMLKYWVGIIFASFFLFIIIPISVGGAVVTHPIQFFSELVFGTGETVKVDKEVIKMYDNFLKSDLGSHSLSYIHELISESPSTYSYGYSYYLVPALLSIQTAEDEKEMSVDENNFKILIKECYNLRKDTVGDTNYCQALKDNDNFSSLKDLSDSTILLYIQELGASTGSLEGIPKTIKDLQTIALGELYSGSGNPFVASGYRGQCTWWAWSRCLDVTGYQMPTNDARNWWSSTNFPQGKEPRSLSVLDLWDDGYGKQHVIFIEDYSNGIITYSEGNMGGDGTVEYTREHYLEMLRCGSMEYSLFLEQRIKAYDNYTFIYTKDKSMTERE